MARHKVVDMSPRLLPVDLEAQLIPGSFAHAVHHVVDALDLSAFDAHYRNDEVGASAHVPAMLHKAVLLAYSQGMISSRSIERECRDNVLFIALTGDAKPHFTTIADFVGCSPTRRRRGFMSYHSESAGVTGHFRCVSSWRFCNRCGPAQREYDGAEQRSGFSFRAGLIRAPHRPARKRGRA